MTHVEWLQLESVVARMSGQEKARLLALIRSSLASTTLESSKGVSPSHFTSEQFDSELSRIAFAAPPLPDDFSRADIYSEHD